MMKKARIWDLVTFTSAWAFFISLALIVTTPYYSIPHTLGLHLLMVSAVSRLLWSAFARNASSFTHFIPQPSKILSNLYLTLTLDATPYHGHSAIGGMVAFLTLVFGVIASYYGITEHTEYAYYLQLTVFSWVSYALGVALQMAVQHFSPFKYIYKGETAIYENTVDDKDETLNTSVLSVFIDKFALPSLVIGFFTFAAVAPTLVKHDVDIKTAFINPQNQITETNNRDLAQELADIETAAGDENLEESINFTTLDELRNRQSSTPQIGRVNTRAARDEMRQKEQQRQSSPAGFYIPIETE